MRSNAPGSIASTARAACAGDGHVVSLAPQDAAHGELDAGLVLHQQNSAAHALLLLLDPYHTPRSVRVRVSSDPEFAPAGPSPEIRLSALRPLLFGIAAYTLWGVVPVYWKLVQSIAPGELLAHRIVWGLAVAIVLLAATRGFRAYRSALRTPRLTFAVALAALLLAINWLVFIYAVTTDRVLATSLGYYLNPLVNVVLGLFVLGERLRAAQWAAVGIAAVGVAGYVLWLGELPWIAVVLALSFGLYGLLRKLASIEPITGFAVEMSVLAAPAAAFVLWLGVEGRQQVPTGSLGLDLLVAASGVVTAAPLLCFNVAARGLPLATVGILQYIAPSIALVLAVAAYGEPFEPVHAFTFGCVWIALAIFTIESVRHIRAVRA